jgi:CheY-like chemotaxis protein
MLSDLVQTFCYRTATASNAVQALVAVREFLPHVVFLDIRMPGIAGRAGLREQAGRRSRP